MEIDRINFIREYYKPIQPTIKSDNHEIDYKEIIPIGEAKNFVYCFWQLKTKRPTKESIAYRVVSDGCIDIFFESKLPEKSSVMGFCRRYTEFQIGNSFNYIGIRFLPSAFPILFNIDAKKLSNQSQKLDNVLPSFAEWIRSKISSTESLERIVKKLDGKLCSIIQNQSFDFDARFFNSLELIFKRKGHLDIERGLSTGLSPRQLRRIFNFYIGTTAKAFSNVVRFQHILNLEPTMDSLKKNKLYFDIGFYDQAHFVKNFKTFYGVPPSKALR